MRRRNMIATALSLGAAAVVPVAAFADEPDDLFARLLEATSEAEAREIENRIWLFWMQGPDEAATALMQEAMAARRNYDYAGALELIERLLEQQPDYAEAWNQKATLLFLTEQLDASLDAIIRVMELEPRHFGALAGRAIILTMQGRMALGQEALRQAIAINPYLKERHMLVRVPEEEL